MPCRPAEPADGLIPYESGCLIWTGTTNRQGHPIATISTPTGTTTTTAARREWERDNGPVPDGKVLASYCGTKLCIRPDHHEPVTVTENRYRTGSARLNETLAKRAYQASKRGKSLSQIAAAFGVSRRTAGRIARGEYWALREMEVDTEEAPEAVGHLTHGQTADGRHENEGRTTR